MKPKKAQSNGSGFGPVDNLEKYLQPDWWRRVFNATYLKTDADVVEDRQITEAEVLLFSDVLELKPEDKVLDLACGQGRHLIEWARQGQMDLNGIDRSRFLIQRARSTSKQEGLSITFKEGDVRKLPYPTDTFDVVTILGNSFGYFESSQDDEKILREVFRVLKPNGRFLMDVSDGSYLKEHFVPRSWEWIDQKHFVCRERSLAADGNRLISREVVTHSEKGVIVDQFYAERLYTHEELEEMLRVNGFRHIQRPAEIGPSSQCNQDLGMMERRIVLTARVLKEWTPRKVGKEVKNVVVVMGDPNLRDVIKPDAKFDSDDHYTIEQLRMALSELDDYRFQYLSDHGSLIQDLQKLRSRPDLVLNLCDEGFNNEALKELHVPALLEMLNLPYTGSNPQSLAYCYDKSLVRGIAAEMGIQVASAMFIKPDDNLYELNLNFPVIAKPNFGDSSFGITARSVANNIEELDEAIVRIRKQFGYDKPLLVEEFLPGAEISVGVIGNTPGSFNILPLIEEDYSDLPEGLPRICGYEAKWLTGSPYFENLKSIRATVDQNTANLMVSDSLKLFERLNCRDYCRFDWRLDINGIPRILEVNPNPIWCWDGHMAKMAAFDGMSYAGMLQAIIEAAEHRVEQAGDFGFQN